MRLRKMAILLVAVPVAIWAADPFVGTWKMNPSKSHYTKGTPPKEQTVTISESGDNQDVTVTITAADGASISYHFCGASERWNRQRGSGSRIRCRHGQTNQ